VYTDAWKPIDSIPVNSEDIERFDVAWAKPVPKAPAAPPPPPAPPAPPAIPQPPVAPATIAVPDTVLSALAALDGVVPVREAEEVIIPTTGQPAPILTLVSSQPLPPEKEHAGTPEPVAVVAQEPTRWYPGIPAPADIAPAGIPGKGRPKLSPFAKQHPPRKKVGSPSPFWRDMQPMIHGLFVLGPANCPPDNTLGTLESFTQLVHVVRGALGSLDQGATVGDVQNWLDDVWAQITESPAWPAIEASLVKYNAADSGEGDTE
jgi:hypothetical protein